MDTTSRGLLRYTIIIAIVSIAFIGVGQLVRAYDVPEVIDQGRNAVTRSIDGPQVYRFIDIQMENATYSNGNVYPSMTAEIQKYNFTTGQWENYGYTNTHMHNVKVDGTDVLDVSLGHTDRINPKH